MGRAGWAVLAALLACGALCGQIRVLATPEPLEVLRATGVRNLGVWTIGVCNDGKEARVVSPERIRMLLPELRIVEPSRAAALLNQGQRRSKRATLARLLAYGAALATSFTGSGLVSANPTIISALALGTVTLNQASSWTASTLPDLSPFSSNLLSSSLDLPAGGCATRSVFTALMKHARPMSATEALR